MNKYIFLACLHDRHTDDKYAAFENIDDAKTQCRIWVEKYPKDRYFFGEDGYGKWSLFCTDDYYATVQKVTMHWSRHEA